MNHFSTQRPRRPRSPFAGRRLPVALAAAVLAGTLAGPVQAIGVTWAGAGADNSWSNGANWVGGLAPVNGDYLVFETSSQALIQNDLVGLQLDALVFNAGASAFTLNGNALKLSSGAGIWNDSDSLQTFNVGVQLLGQSTWSGSGRGGMVFNGAVDVNDKRLTLDDNVTINNAGIDWVVGKAGNSELNIYTQSSVNTGAFTVAQAAGSSGRVILSSAPSANLTTGVLVVGRAGAGTLWATMGKLNTGDAYVGGDWNNTAATSGLVTIESADAKWSSTGTITVGSSSATTNATLTIKKGGGVSSSSGRIGVYAGGGGTATVSGFDPNFANASSHWTVANGLEVGVEGNGALTITEGGQVSSGTAWVGGSSFAQGVGGVGVLSVDGAGSTFSTGDLYVGYRGTGTLNIGNAARVNSVNATVGAKATALGTANVSGAQSVWANSGRLDIGVDGIGRVTVSDGGQVSNQYAFIGSNTTGAALASSMTVTGAGSTWASNAALYVNNGELLVDAGGQVSASSMYAGHYARGSGSITVQGSGSLLTVAGGILLGDGESGGPGGSLTVLGGGSATAANLRVGPQGTLSVSDGSATLGQLLVNGGLNISQHGSVTSVTTTVGGDATAVGTVNVSGDRTLWVNNGRQDIGLAGIGHMTVSGGAQVSSQEAYIGAETTGAAMASSVTVTGPISSWASSADLYVNNGALRVEDGAGVSALSVDVGSYAGAGGSITVQGGGAQLRATDWIWLGAGEAASTGGSLTVLAGGRASAARILVGDRGSLNLAGGTLNLGNASDAVSTGQFTWTSGTLHFSGDASFADGTLLRNSTTLGSGMALAVDGVLNLGEATLLTMNGGALQGGTLNLSGVATVGAGSSLTAAAGLNNFGSLQLAGGTLGGQGALYNSATVAGHGRIDGAGGFTNGGLLTQAGGDLVLANTGYNANQGTWKLLEGRQLVLSASELNNLGQINLNGGFVVGSGALINEAQGTLSGSGRIDTGFFNLGTVVLDQGQTTITQSFTNRGQIFLGANSATLAGGQIGNHGLIQGLGKVSSNISNIDPVGVIEAQGGTLTLSGLIVSPNGGTLAAGSGAKLLITQGLANNAGQIQLAGGTLDNNNKAMVNASNGVISGYGTLRTGGLTQDGQVQFSGGAAVPSAVYGSVLANAGSKTILSGNSNVTFYGAVDVQSGAELRVSTGSVATFFGLVQQRSGALFTGSGSKRFEGGLSVGGSPGVGTDEGDVEFGDANVYLGEIGGITACTLACGSNEAARNSGYDKYIVNGQLSLGGTLKLVSWNGFVAQAGQQFDLLDWGTLTGSFGSIDASGFTLAAGTALDFSQLYTTGTVAVTAVPEPGTLALWLAGLAAGGLARRRAGRTSGSTPAQQAGASR